jgi:anaerobic selenocysteine-containing dehydrogenase
MIESAWTERLWTDHLMQDEGKVRQHMANVRPAIMTIPGACSHDCPDRCAWLVTVEGDRAVKLAGDPDHPFTRGLPAAGSAPRSITT